MDKFLHHFQSVVADGYVWSTADILPHDVGLLETDCEAKFPTYACEALILIYTCENREMSSVK